MRKKSEISRLILTSEFKVAVEKLLKIRFVTSAIRNSPRGFSKSQGETTKLVLNQDYIQQSLIHILYVKSFVECIYFVIFRFTYELLRKHQNHAASNYI